MTRYMNCPTHTQDSFKRVLKPLLELYKSPPLYTVAKLEQEIFSHILLLTYKSLSKTDRQFFPKKPENFLTYKLVEQERLLSLLLLKRQMAFFAQVFTQKLPLYSMKTTAFQAEAFVSDLGLPELEKWPHYGKIYTKRLTLLLKFHYLLSLSASQMHLFSSKGDDSALSVEKKKGYEGKKVFDIAGLRFYFHQDSWKSESFDQSLVSFLSLFRCSSKGKISAVTQWQNLPQKTLKFKYKLLKKHINSLYSFLPQDQKEKIFKKIDYFLRLSYLSTVSKKCKISVCRAKQLS